MYCVPKYSLDDPKFFGGDRRKVPLTHPAPVPPLQIEPSILGRQSASVSICSSLRMMDFDPPPRMAPIFHQWLLVACWVETNISTSGC